MIQGTVGQRRRYFIKKTFQLKMILQFFFILILGGTFLGLELYFFTSNELDTKLFNAHMRIIDTWDILLPTIILTLISVFILVSIITFYTVLYLSHKIAGPLYKFEKITDEIGKGNLNVDVRLRKKDELISLQAAFEIMLENLQNKIWNFKNNFEKIKKTEKTLKNAIQTSALSETDKKTLATTMKELIIEYQESLNAFKIKDIKPVESSSSIYCPTYKWIGKCPAFPPGGEDTKRQAEIDKIS